MNNQSVANSANHYNRVSAESVIAVKKKDDVIIEVVNLLHRFPDGTAGVDRISLSIRRGAFVIMAGPNGSGKTTLLRHFNGLAMPSAGTVKINGISVKENLVRARRVVGMVFQDADSQIVGETVSEDVAFGPENLGMDPSEIDSRTRWALEKVGLSHMTDAAPHFLSGGEKRRLAVAGVLSMKPEIIVFDEPFSNLDYPGICQVVEQMRTLHAEGHTIVVASHDLDPVIGLADRLIFLNRGRVVRDGEPAIVAPDAALFGIRPVTGFMPREERVL